MPRGEMLRPTHAALLKKAIALAVLVALGYGGYRYFLARRPALPDVGAEMVAQYYWTALRNGNYQAAYACASSSAQGNTSATEMAKVCREIYASIDSWQLGPPRYSPTHQSASVPVTLYYRPTWASDDQLNLRGDLDFKLEDGEWRLVVALPFIMAIQKGRETQHFGD